MLDLDSVLAAALANKAITDLEAARIAAQKNAINAELKRIADLEIAAFREQFQPLLAGLQALANRSGNRFKFKHQFYAAHYSTAEERKPLFQTLRIRTNLEEPNKPYILVNPQFYQGGSGWRDDKPLTAEQLAHKLEVISKAAVAQGFISPDAPSGALPTARPVMFRFKKIDVDRLHHHMPENYKTLFEGASPTLRFSRTISLGIDEVGNLLMPTFEEDFSVSDQRALYRSQYFPGSLEKALEELEARGQTPPSRRNITSMGPAPIYG